MAASNDFIFFRILHPTIEPSIVYKVCNNSMHRDTMLVIARLWTRSLTLENQLCSKCDTTFQDELVHVICECPYTAAARTQFTESLDNILLPDEKQSIVQLDSVSQTLRLLGGPVEPVLDLDSESSLLKHSFAFIVRC